MSSLHSDFLREDKLNYELKLMCKNFENCKFVETQQSDITKFDTHTKIDMEILCNKLNYEIDKLDYEKKFLTSEGLKIILNANKTCENTFEKPSIGKTSVKPVKGTIPYYFCNKNHPKAISSLIPAKCTKLTIRDYFPVLKKSKAEKKTNNEMFFRE